MTKKDKIEALKRQLILHPSYLTIIEEIEKDLERLESLERENELLKKDLQNYQAYIKKGVEEHYADFVSDYDLLLQENYELNKKLEMLEILKKHYDKDSLVVSIGRFISFYIYNEDTDFNKVKEWLGNE